MLFSALPKTLETDQISSENLTWNQSAYKITKKLSPFQTLGKATVITNGEKVELPQGREMTQEFNKFNTWASHTVDQPPVQTL